MSGNLKVSQEELMAHSEIKVRLLKKYMEAYLNILSSSQHIRDIYLFDLFCGPGIYQNGGEGSPIIFLREIKLAFENIILRKTLSTKFHCVFNDIDSGRMSVLRENIQNENLENPAWGDIEFSDRDYQAVLPEVKACFRKLGNDRGFAFIDPYGYKDINVKDIRELLSGRKSEVLLFLPAQFMYRFENRSTPESLKNFMTDLHITPSADTGSKSIHFIERVKEGFRNALGEQHFVDSFIIGRDKNQFFCLFFFTSHILGYEKMLEAKWSIDNEEGRGWQLKVEDDLFTDFSKVANTYSFQTDLETFLKDSSRSNREIYEFTLRQGFLPKHANEILKELLSHKKIAVTNDDGSKARKNSFYLNYESYKAAPKIIIKHI